MLESLDDEGSSGVLLLDDDAVVEPEGILRALQFEDFARKPVIVGGHMFNRHERTILHSMGERVNPYKFWWDSVSPDVRDIDFAQQRIRTSPVLNRRIDAEYNGWWMCLIPRTVMQEIGLSLPFFIKWDDAEYGLRAEEAGFPTVSLPGAAVWHVPWTEKDDGLDWQAYFHQHNRLIAALLHSPYKYGGMLPRVSLATDVKHLLSLQYTPERLRLLALRDVLQGPEHFAKTAMRRAADARQISKEGPDSRLTTSPGEYPEIKREKPLKKGELPKAPAGRRAFVIRALSGVIRQLLPTEKGAARNPELQISNQAARWWMLSNVDSALVSNAAGSGVWWYRRNRRKFAHELRESLSLYLRLTARWSELSSDYSRALPKLVSIQSWRERIRQSK